MKKKKTLTEKRKQIKREENELLNDISLFNENENNNPVIEPSVFNPDELFSDSGQDSGASVSKELFNPKNPKIKTDISERQIKILTKLDYKSRKYWETLGMYDLRKIIDEFILLSISKDRKSRAEFVETHRETQKNKTMNMFDNMLGRGGGLG